ncbi:hypothetical protein A9Q86_04940 [Flavobacteriales bacterium 33_180_T64]|nr:hypothetical protein A9Q86_04940 [Flavobacteriales bacterium 33_180_T64]
MKVSVWDTYVKRDDGNVMHFDIIVPSDLTNENIIFNFGKTYLEAKSITNAIITTKECRLCHMEQATKAIETQISNAGYFILEIENCN